ncbi:thioester-containing protein 1 allele S3-like [Chironomus tepperi]|uniref:thioester-containing protein 1 allele S3-like n=1 Tax=Chironomus tepperi TaxID=113505 RepID=UPI00391F032A
MKVLIVLLLYLQVFVDCKENDEFITYFSPNSAIDKTDFNVFAVVKKVDNPTEIGVQFRKVNVTAYAVGDNILKIKFPKKKTSGSKKFGDVIYTALRNVTSKSQPQCSTIKSKVKYIKQTYYTFIQLDKPVYAPGHTIKYRIIVIDRNLRPYQLNNIVIKIIDPFNRTIKSFEDLDVMNKGLYSSNFTLSDHTQLGDWTISAVVDKQEFHKVSKIIPVQKYVLPLFTVNVVPISRRLLNGHKLQMSINAKYSYGDFVTGNVTINIKRTSDNYVIKTVSISNVKDTVAVSYSLKDDLKIKVNAKTDFEALILFTELESGSTENKTIKFSVYNENNFKIHVVHPTMFLPGLPYHVRVYTYNWKNESVNIDHEQVKVTFNYKFTNGTGLIEGGSYSTVNGVAIIQKVISNVTKSLEIKANYIDSKLYRAAVQLGTQYLKAKELTVDYGHTDTTNVQLPKLNDEIMIYVKSVVEMDEIVVVIMTRHGNVLSMKEHCGFSISCNFILKITESMIPEATVVVHAVSDVNEFSYGEVLIKSEQLGMNHLNVMLTVPKQVKKSSITTKTKSSVVMEFDTQLNSKVYLMAFDKRLTYLRQGNELTRRDVMDEISKYENKLDVKFEDLKTWHDCTTEELDRIKTGRKSIVAHNEDFMQSNDDEPDEDEPTESDDDQSQSQDNSEDDLLREYFPESWIFEEFDIVKGDEKKTFKVPDSITSWIISAFAMHDTHGIAVADSTEITVKNEFFIKIMAPYSVRFKEIFGFNILVYNYIESKESLTATITLINTDKSIQFVSYDNECKPTFSDKIEHVKTNIEVPYQGVKKITFYIRSHPNLDNFNGIYKLIKLSLNAVGKTSSKTYEDRVRSRLKIEQFGVREYEVITHSNKLSKNINTNWNTVKRVTPDNGFLKLSAIISADYLTDVGNLNTKQDYLYWGYLEDYTTKFKVNVEYMRYMKARNLKPVDPRFYWLYQWILMDRNRGLHYLKHGYDRNAKIDFRYHAGYTAYFIDAIASGMNINAISVNKGLIQVDFRRLKDYQQSDGSFASFGTYPERSSNDAASNKYFETAYILISFLKYRDYFDQDYSELIRKAFNFLDNPSNKLSLLPDAHSIAAYAYALNKNYASAVKHMEEVEKNTITNGRGKIVEKCFKSKSSSTSCDMRHTAYSILAYHAMNQLPKAKPLVLGIVKQFSSDKTFLHQHSIAAEAISTILSESKVAAINMAVNLKNEFDFDKTVIINGNNLDIIHEIKFPDNSEHAIISTNGSGWCTVTIVKETLVTLKSLNPSFKLTINNQQSIINQYSRVMFCFTFIGKVDDDDVQNDIRMELEMPTGYMFVEVEDTLNKQFIEDVDTKNIKSVVIMRFGNIEKLREYCFTVKAKRVFDVKNPVPAGVKLYNFRHKDNLLIDFYSASAPTC